MSFLDESDEEEVEEVEVAQGVEDAEQGDAIRIYIYILFFLKGP